MTGNQVSGQKSGTSATLCAASATNINNESVINPESFLCDKMRGSESGKDLKK